MIEPLLNICFHEGSCITLTSVTTGCMVQAFVVIEGLERNFGLDPNDPIVQFLVLLGSSVAIG